MSHNRTSAEFARSITRLSQTSALSALAGGSRAISDEVEARFGAKLTRNEEQLLAASGGASSRLSHGPKPSPGGEAKINSMLSRLSKATLDRPAFGGERAVASASV